MNIASKISNFLELLLTRLYHTAHYLKKSEIEALGVNALWFLPILDIAQAAFYAIKLKNSKSEPTSGKYFTLALRTLKAVVTTLGMVAILGGLAAVGYMAIFCANAVFAVRSLGKTVNYLWNGEYRKAGNQFFNFLIGGALAASFALLFVFPQAAVPAYVAWALVISSVGLGIGKMVLKKLAGKGDGDVVVAAPASAPVSPVVAASEARRLAATTLVPLTHSYPAPAGTIIGEDIVSLEARVVAVCERLDALLEQKPMLATQNSQAKLKLTSPLSILKSDASTPASKRVAALQLEVALESLEGVLDRTSPVPSPRTA